MKTSSSTYSSIFFKFLVVLLLFSAQDSLSQRQIKGRVISAEDKTPLPYASVYTPKGEFSFSNDDGYFIIKGRLGDKVNFSFLGFRDTTIVLLEQNTVIEMVNDGFITDEIVITDKHYISPYKTLAAALKQYKKEKGDEVDTKLFVKRESINNGEWADRTEVVYNYKHKNRRIYDMTFKHGKSYINTENDIILTLDLFELLKTDWLFDKSIKSLYTSIISNGSARKMRKKFDATYSEYSSNGKEYFMITSKPLETGSAFSTKVIVDKTTNDFVEIHNRITDPNVVKFRSIRTSKPIDLTAMDITYRFVQHEEMTFLSHIDVTYTYNLNGVESVNNLAFHIFDIGFPYQENITEINYEPLSDYQKVWATPYSEDFWIEQDIAESQLDTLTNYIDLGSSVKSLLKNKPFLTLDDAEVLGTKHFEHRGKMNDGSYMKFGKEPQGIKNNLHLEAFFHLNTFEKGGKLINEITPVINYDRSFILKSTPLVVLQFKKELKVLKEIYAEFDLEMKNQMSTQEMDKYKYSDLVDKYNQKLWRALSKLDSYQFYNWDRYNAADALYERSTRRRF